MKLNPANLTTPQQVKVFERAQSVIDTVQDFYDRTLSADNTAADSSPAPGCVAVSHLGRPGDRLVKQGVLRPGTFAANISVPSVPGYGGYSRQLPSAVSRTETAERITYVVADQCHDPDPRAKVILDKQTGEMDYREYYFGFIRKPV